MVTKGFCTWEELTVNVLRELIDAPTAMAVYACGILGGVLLERTFRLPRVKK